MKNWDDLKYVLAIHRYGGLSAAARMLNVNHSTVSRRIGALEEEMGVRLFDRMPNGLQITSHGEKAIEAAEVIERQCLDLNFKITSKDTELAGPLKISAPQMIIQFALLDIIADFKRAYPQIDLNIIATSDMVNLHRREADISIRAILEPQDTLWGQQIVTQNCAFYGQKDYLKNRPKPDGLDCLNFMWWGDQPANNILQAYPSSRVITKFDDMVTVYAAVQAGLGVARMPCFMGDTHPDLIRVPHIPPVPYHDLWILTHPDLKDVPRIQTFMRHAAKHFRKRKDVFLGKA